MKARGMLIFAGLIGLGFVAGLLVGKAGNRNSAAGGSGKPGTGEPPGSLIGSTPANPAGDADVTRVARPPVPPDRSPESVAIFAKDTLAESNRVTRLTSWMGLIANLTKENWREARQAFTDERTIHGRHHHEEWALFAEKAGEVVGEDAIAEFFEASQPGAVRNALAGWAKVDPKAALDWAETVPDPEFRDQIWGSLVIGIAQTDPDLSMRLLEQLPLKDRIEYVPNLMATIVQTAGLDEGVQIFYDAVNRAESRGEDAGSDFLKRLFATLANKRITNTTLPGKGEWASQHLGKPYINDYFITKTAKNIARDNPREALDWLDREVSPEEALKAYPDLVKDWISYRGTDDVTAWLNGNPQHQDYDHIANYFSRKILKEDPAAALNWANTIRDGQIREKTVQDITEATIRIAK